MKKNLVVLSGAGMSAESGLKTFRDADGLWEGHDVMEVASIDGWFRNPDLVLDFYNKRRSQLLEAHPNRGHHILAELEDTFHVSIITQNVDDLHERAGSTTVLHLHGELFKVRSTKHPEMIYEWKTDLSLGEADAHGNQLRPHIVWFGEEVPAMEEAMSVVRRADIVVVIGTSLQVYPAASLIHFADEMVPIYYIDPRPATLINMVNPVTIIAKNASDGMMLLKDELLHSP